MSDGGEAREETRGHLDLIRAEAAGERRALEVPVSWRSRIPASTVLAVALGAAALGGLGAWFYRRASGNPQHRASHQIEDLRHRLNQLVEELARLTEAERRAGAEAS